MAASKWTLLACLLLALGGCGNSRTPIPTTQRGGAPARFQILRYPAAGIAVRAPRDWTATPGRGPLVATVISGPAVVALWRYRRTSAPPTGAALRMARRILILAARARDHQLVVIQSRIARIDGAPAIELDALEQVAGRRRRVRSTHVYERRAEIVLDEFAPPQAFQSVDQRVFSPLKQSLALFPATAA